MTIDTFTQADFEAALPIHKDTDELLWVALGLKQGEHTYRVAGPDGAVAIEVRSSVGPSGMSAPRGEDSIRTWLVNSATGEPLGSKAVQWTTRLPGWQERLIEVLRTLWSWRMRAGDCPQCDRPKGIWKVKKLGKNKGRPFAKCRHCGDGFVWLDIEPKSPPYFASNVMDDWKEATPPEPPENHADGNTGSANDEGANDESVEIQTKTQPRLLAESEAESSPECAHPLPKDSAPKLPSPLGFLGKDVKVVAGEDGDQLSTSDQALTREPNPEQLAAITASVGAAVRVLAPPGSGKTFVIARRYAFLLEHGAKPKDILAVTFSKSMADELLQRITRVNPSVVGTAAENQVCTIHAACYRMLRGAGDSRRVPKIWQVKRLIQDIAEGLWPLVKERPGWTEIVSWIDNAKFHNLASTDDLDYFIGALGDHHGRNLHEARRKFDRGMKRQNLITFADMLFDVEQRLEYDDAFRSKWQTQYKWLLVDEGQDTSSQAMRILTTLAEPQRQVTLVGDSDQLLYRFAGAAPEANLFDGFESRYPDGLMVKLSVNYRSTEAIITSCQQLIAENYIDAGGPYDQKYLKDMQSRPGAPQGDQTTFEMYASPEYEAVALVDNLTEAIAAGRKPGDFFVGSRTRAQLGYLEGPLTRAKIPFINIAGGSFWGSKHVANIVAYLALAHDEGNDEAFGRIFNVASRWNTHPWGKHEGEYCSHRYLGKAFTEACGGSYRGARGAIGQRRSFRPGAEDLISFVRELQSTLAEGPSVVLRQVIDDCYHHYLRAEEGIAVTDEAENGKLQDLETVVDVAGQFSNCTEFLDYVRDAIAAANAAKDKDWSDHVVISTVHRLKGLERPVVFGVGICEGYTSSGGLAGLLPHTFSLKPPPNNGVLPSGGQGRIADERCIFYVLCSRAKEEVHLSGCAAYRKATMGPSRFIAELLEQILG